MASKDTLLDFHFEFSGTVNYRHLVSGKQRIYLLQPSLALNDRIVELEQKAIRTGRRTTFLADLFDTDSTLAIDVTAGQTLLLPNLWARAILVLENSVVLEGNLLTTSELNNQIVGFNLERKLGDASRLWPCFELIHYLAVPTICRQLSAKKERLISGDANDECLVNYVTFAKFVQDYIENPKAKASKNELAAFNHQSAQSTHSAQLAEIREMLADIVQQKSGEQAAAAEVTDEKVTDKKMTNEDEDDDEDNDEDEDEDEDNDEDNDE